MKLSDEAIEALKNSLDARNRLAYELSKHNDTIDKWIARNDEYNPLTRPEALKFISEETGLKVTKLTTEKHPA